MKPSMRSFLLDSLRRRPPRDGALRLSMAGSRCARDLYYSASGAPADPCSDERLLKMALGSALDELALRHSPGAETHVPVTVTMGDVSVPGVADLVLHGKNGPLLVADLKVVGDGTWSRTKNTPLPEHRAQVNLYAWALGSPRWSVCYVHASTGELREHFGKTDAFAARRDFGAFEEASYWLRAGTPPPRPYEDSTGFPCRFCPHQNVCWQGDNDHDAVSNAN
jgi:hypothetical protein